MNVYICKECGWSGRKNETKIKMFSRTVHHVGQGGILAVDKLPDEEVASFPICGAIDFKKNKIEVVS